MKIQHVTAYPFGGAGIACRRIHQALQNAGIGSSITYRPRRAPFFWRCLYFLIFLLQKLQRSTNPMVYHSAGAVPGLISVDELNHSNSDIIHLHWVNENTLGIKDIAKLRKPVVWTLHDSWPVCGSEHYPDILHGDRRYQTGYTAANRPVSSRGPDWDKWVWRWKKHCWKDLHCTFTAPSLWEAGCLESSALFRGQKCRVIPNCLNQRIYTPVNCFAAKQKWALPPDKKILLFGAQKSNDPIKGGQYLKTALKSLAQKRGDLFLLCFGAGNDVDFQDYGIPYQFTGRLSGDEVLASVYQAADVFICPSVAESFGQTALEAISCGVPVTAFNATGVTDIVRHQENGYLAQPYEPDDLGNGILYCLENHDILSTQARTYAETHFSEKEIAEQFIKLYQEVLGRS